MSEKQCKKCKSKVTVAYIQCVKCGVCYHRSCAQLLQDRKKLYTAISEYVMVCNDHLENLNEMDFVQEEVSHSKDFNDYLHSEEFSSLLEKITARLVTPYLDELKFLRQEVRDLKTSNIELVRILTHSEKSEKSYGKFSWHRETTSEEPHVSKVLIHHNQAITKNPAIKTTERKINTPSIDLPPPSDQLMQQSCPLKETAIFSMKDTDKPRNNESTTKEEGNDFILVKNKRKTFRQKGIIGTATQNEDNSCQIKGQERKAWLYVGRLSKETKDEDLEIFLRKGCPTANQVTVKRLPSKGNNASYCVGIDFACKDVLMDPEFWPKGIEVRRFNLNFNKPNIVGESKLNAQENLNLKVNPYF